MLFLRIILAPLGAIYWLVSAFRNWLYNAQILKSSSFDIPIISVGNLSVGGNGKTPMIEHLIEVLQEEYNIAVLSRGYGRKSTGFVEAVSDSKPNEVGDEPLQIKLKFKKIVVAVCEKRVDGVIEILAKHPDTNLVLLDDAFQHRAIARDIDIVLSDSTKPFTKDYILPIGRLREPRFGCKRADAVIWTKTRRETQNKTLDVTTFKSFTKYQEVKENNAVYGFSGLANNSYFKNYLKDNYSLTGFKGFTDHFKFEQQHLNKLVSLAGDSTLFCTEKDWVKIKLLNGAEKVKYIPIKTVINDEALFVNWLKNALEETGKTNSTK